MAIKTYLDTLAQYHLHPETKFRNGDYCDKGRTQRRHVIAASAQHIGKEANKWEEQVFIGLDPDAQIEYGQCPEQKEEHLQAVLHAIEVYGTQRMAAASKLSPRYVQNIRQGKQPSETTLAKLYTTAKHLDVASASEQVLRDEIKAMMKEKGVTLRHLSEKLNMDVSNLSKIISGKRRLSENLKNFFALHKNSVTVEL